MDIDLIESLILSLQDNLLLKGSQYTPYENPCVEYTENIYILIIGCLDQLQKCANWDKIYENIIKVRKTNKSENKNITSKIIFKHMDIIDALKKHDSEK